MFICFDEVWTVRSDMSLQALSPSVDMRCQEASHLVISIVELMSACLFKVGSLTEFCLIHCS